MSDFIYATIKDPQQRHLRDNVAERYNRLYILTNKGTIPVRFKVKNNGKIRYDDKLADLVGMSEVVTKRKYVNEVPHKDRKQYLLPI